MGINDFNLTAKESRQVAETALRELNCEKSKFRESFTESLLESLSGYITDYSKMGKFEVGVSVLYYSFRNKAKERFSSSEISEGELESMFESIIGEVKSVVESQGYVVSVEFKLMTESGWSINWNENHGAKFDISW